MPRLQATRGACDKLADFWFRAPPHLRRQITAASAQIDRLLVRPDAPRAGFPRPTPNRPDARALRVYPVVACFVYLPARDTVVVFDYLLDALPALGP